MVAAFPAPAAGPPTVPAGDPTAVFGRRVVAFLIDTAIIYVPTVLLLSSRLQSFDTSGTGRSANDFCDAYTDEIGGVCFAFNDTAYFDDSALGVESLLPIVLSVLLLVVIQGLTGATAGKALMGIRTVKEDGSIVGIPRAALRWVLLIVDMLPCLGLVGLITAGTSTGHRRVGDMAARTHVVRTAAVGSPITSPPATGPTSYGAPVPPSPPDATWGSAPPQPPQPAPPTAAPPAAAPPAVDPSGPQWDAARGTYIQWDPNQSLWLQWDETTRTWSSIPGQ